MARTEWYFTWCDVTITGSAVLFDLLGDIMEEGEKHEYTILKMVGGYRMRSATLSGDVTTGFGIRVADDALTASEHPDPVLQ